MKVGVVSGDGLAVSGLLTVFRNVVELGCELGLVELPVASELGYSWRPDKPSSFPHGSDGEVHRSPGWMTVAVNRAVDRGKDAELAADLFAVRAGVANHASLGEEERAALRAKVDSLSDLYREHFAGWLAEVDVDWVFALNMTLSDAVPATIGLHTAAEAHFEARGRGGVVFWDHDLFGSCAIRDPESGERLYPEAPNELVPLPRPSRHTRWIVISPGLAREAAAYGTGAAPELVPNVLPDPAHAPTDDRLDVFVQQHRLDASRPILLNPVRMFRIKGVHVAVELLAAMKHVAQREGSPVPYLLAFGELAEDPDYAEEVTALVHAHGLDDDVRFLNGVPLRSHVDAEGSWWFDEVDLLRLGVRSHGGVVFTPGVPDVETVGMGPALAAVAGLPCAMTPYNFAAEVYGEDFAHTRVVMSPDGIRHAARELLSVLHAFRDADHALFARLSHNKQIVADRFPDTAWRALWRDLADDVS